MLTLKKKAEQAPMAPVPAQLPVEIAIDTLEQLQAERSQALTALEAGRNEAQRAEDALGAERDRIATEAEGGGAVSRTGLMQLRESAEAAQVRLTGLTRRIKAFDARIESTTAAVRDGWMQLGHVELANFEKRFERACLEFDAVIKEGLARGVVLPGWSPVLVRLMRISILSRERKHLIVPDRFKFRTDAKAMQEHDRFDAIRQRISRVLQGNDMGATLATPEADEGEAA